MTLAKTNQSILLLKLKHFRIISKKETKIPIPSEYHLRELSSIIHTVNYKADVLGLSIAQIAAEYFVRICCGHKLLDGNKRMAVISFGYFLDINKKSSTLTKSVLRNVAIALAHQETSSIPISIKIAYFQELISDTLFPTTNT